MWIESVMNVFVRLVLCGMAVFFIGLALHQADWDYQHGDFILVPVDVLIAVGIASILPHLWRGPPRD